MCGLAGFARTPGYSAVKPCISAVEAMLLKMEHRGKHATGFATMDTSGKTNIFKRAVEVKIAAASEPWKAATKAMNDETVVMMAPAAFDPYP